jgi:uncharacterized protein YndB with AHSA1/START domain
LPHWWGLRANTMRVEAHDLRPGGAWRYVETDPKGEEFVFYGTFQEVVPHERLVHTFEYEPWAGHVIVETTTLTDLGAQTLVRNRSRFATQEDLDGMVEAGMEFGANQGWDRLEELLATLEPAPNGAEEDVEDASLTMERTFNAPRDLVFAACTEAEHLQKWFGPKGFTIKVAQMDLRAGGTFLYAIASPEGNEMWGEFVYTAVMAPRRVDYVNSFTDAEGAIVRHPLSATWPLELHNSWRFTERDGVTTLHMQAVPINATAEERATFAQARAGVEGGTNGTLDQLEKYLASLQ